MNCFTQVLRFNASSSASPTRNLCKRGNATEYSRIQQKPGTFPRERATVYLRVFPYLIWEKYIRKRVIFIAIQILFDVKSPQNIGSKVLNRFLFTCTWICQFWAKTKFWAENNFPGQIRKAQGKFFKCFKHKVWI